MSLNSRATVIGIKKETTEGTLIAPDGVGAYVARQDDFSMEPGFEQIENAEVKNSLGKSKTITGMENPSASFSHYLRHSGTEGQAPGYGVLLESMLGAVDTEATEYDTVADSTVSAINVDTDEGATFRRGQALLLKDGTNGRSIRPVHSVLGDVLTPGFNLSSAPAAGVNLGKATTYYPANADHPTFSLWRYIANSGAVDAIAGARVTDLSLDISAGQLINGSYSIEALAYYWNPLQVTSSNKYLDFTDDNDTYACTMTEKWYKDPHDLADAIAAAMNAADTAETFACVYSNSTGKFTISTSTSTLLSLLWKTGTHGADNTDTHIGTLLGYSDSADDTLAATYTGDSALDHSAPHTPSYDDTDPLIAKANEVYLGDATDTTCFEAESSSVSFGTPKTDINSVCAESGRSGSIQSERAVEISLVTELSQHDADKFRRMRANTETRFCYIGGTKTGGNWVEGTCFCIYAPTCTVSSYTIEESEGRVIMNITVKTFVNSSGDGEIYISLV